MSALVDRLSVPSPEQLIGTWRRFGETGPVYEIIAVSHDGMMRIRIAETGEEVDYRLDALLDDPRAA